MPDHGTPEVPLTPESEEHIVLLYPGVCSVNLWEWPLVGEIKKNVLIKGEMFHKTVVPRALDVH